jgi:hypothetical protein
MGTYNGITLSVKETAFSYWIFTSCRVGYVAGISRESAASIFRVEVISASKVKLELSLTTPRSPGCKLDVSIHNHVRLF